MGGKSTPIVRSPKGHPLTRNPARIEYAAEQIRLLGYTDAVKAVVAKWKIHPTTAKSDIAAARQLVAHEMNGLEVRASETLRNERIAEKAERLADEAAKKGELGAAASLHRAVIAASREVSRLTGAYTPSKVEVRHTAVLEAPLALDAILAILDDTGRAAMHVVLEQIEAAKGDGRLALPAPDDEVPPDPEPVEDAEIVGESGPGTGSTGAN